MRHQALPLVVVLSAVFGFARTASEKDTARAIQGAHQLHDSVANPDSLQVSRALVTGGNICIDYRSRSGSGAPITGIAVYEAQKNLLFVDNSWIWQRACLFGKYAQRREGADVTEAMSDALRKQTEPVLNVREEPAVRPVPPAVSAASSAPKTHKAVTRTKIVTTPTAQPVASVPAEPPSPVAKAPAAPVVEARATAAPVSQPAVPTQPIAPVAPAPSPAPAATASATVATAAPTQSAVVVPVQSPVPAAVPTQPVAPVVPAPPPAPAAIASAAVAPTPAAPSQPAGALAEIHVSGAVIIGPGGTVPGSPPPAPAESLGDAARRLKREKLQRPQGQTP